MAIKKVNYTGSSKVIINLCKAVNALIDGGGGGGTTYTAGDGIDISAQNVISTDYFKVVNGELCQVYDDGE